MTAYVFPGQGAQFVGMGKDLYMAHDEAKALFVRANEILGFKLSNIMFEGSAEDLKQTKVTQPAIFLHSIISYRLGGKGIQPSAVAGHSLGEFSALVACGALSFEDGLQLVSQRANAMQEACEGAAGTMAAVIGLDDKIVEDVCNAIDKTVVAANYNCPGQLVISGSEEGIEAAVVDLKKAGARMVKVLQVGGAFHSPMMAPAKDKLEAAIKQTTFKEPQCPIYQNITAASTTSPMVIQENLIAQLTAPVRWTQTVQNMLADGIEEFVEVGGTGAVLRGMIKRINRKIPTKKLEIS